MDANNDYTNNERVENIVDNTIIESLLNDENLKVLTKDDLSSCVSNSISIQSKNWSYNLINYIVNFIPYKDKFLN